MFNVDLLDFNVFQRLFHMFKTVGRALHSKSNKHSGKAQLFLDGSVCKPNSWLFCIGDALVKTNIAFIRRQRGF